MFRHADVICLCLVFILNPAFCITCSLLMLVEDARSDHMEEAYSRAGLITALKICLPHHVAVSAFMICVSVLRWCGCVCGMLDFSKVLGAFPWVVHFKVQIARIFCRVGRKQNASCFVWI